MVEKVIYPEGIAPLDLYGVNNSLYERIRSFFPKLKIVARGSEIKVMGEDSEIRRFEDALQSLIAYHRKYNRLTEADVDCVMNDTVGAGADLSEPDGSVIVYGNNGKSIRARTVNQRLLADEYRQNDLLFAIGPAGTGKTYTAIALAVAAFKNKTVKKIILTRPAVEAGEKLGFLPGDMKEKLDPYLQPLYDALHDMIPPKKLSELIEAGTVQIVPLAYMRGRTLDHAFVILDEAQNATVNQLKMFLTRMGRNAKFIVTGDVTQIDLPNRQLSGLSSTVQILKDISGISVIRFDRRDIIRHPLVKDIVTAYENLMSNENE
ncbi:MAG: PhoH family protein [Bacteroidales bacterium]|jgi:phosphate starvation-inducible PhoH-like protein|nr:PhoH family protein [Bacteroidales bacterium]